MEDSMSKTENVMIRVIKVWDITIMGGTNDGQTLTVVALLLNLSDRLSKLSIRQVVSVWVFHANLIECFVFIFSEMTDNLFTANPAAS